MQPAADGGPRSGDRLTRFTSDGLVFDVRDDGPRDGTVVIALHGFPQTSVIWSAVTSQLVPAGYRVLAPDQRGYSPGARPSGVAAYGMDALTADVLALADAAGAARFHLLGHDWGAAVAWTLASRSDRVLSLSAVSVPHPGALRRAFAGSQLLRSWYIGAFQLPRLPELLLRIRGGVLARRLLGATGMRSVDASVRLLSDPRAARGAIDWYRAIRLRGQLPARRVRIPTLFVWSEGDTAIGRPAAEGAAAFVLADYRFEVLRGSHWIPEEEPEALAALVLKHLAEHR